MFLRIVRCMRHRSINNIVAIFVVMSFKNSTWSHINVDFSLSPLKLLQKSDALSTPCNRGVLQRT
jgi:hypothetical protein